MTYTARSVFPPSVANLLDRVYSVVHCVGSSTPLFFIDAGTMVFDRSILLDAIQTKMIDADEAAPLNAVVMKRGLSAYLSNKGITVPTRALMALTAASGSRAREWGFDRTDLQRVYGIHPHPYRLEWGYGDFQQTETQWFQRLADAQTALKDARVLDGTRAVGHASLYLGSQLIFRADATSDAKAIDLPGTRSSLLADALRFEESFKLAQPRLLPAMPRMDIYR